MIEGNTVVMKKSIDRLGIRKGARGAVRTIDRKGRVMITFEKDFGVEFGKPLGKGFLFDPNGEYTPEEYLELTNQGTGEVVTTSQGA